MAAGHVWRGRAGSWLRRRSVYRMPVKDWSNGFLVRLFICSRGERWQQWFVPASLPFSGGHANYPAPTRCVRQGNLLGSAPTYAGPSRELSLLGRNGSTGRGTRRRRLREKSGGTAAMEIYSAANIHPNESRQALPDCFPLRAVTAPGGETLEKGGGARGGDFGTARRGC